MIVFKDQTNVKLTTEIPSILTVDGVTLIMMVIIKIHFSSGPVIPT